MEMYSEGLKLLYELCVLESGNCLKCQASGICLKVCGGSSPKQMLKSIEYKEAEE